MVSDSPLPRNRRASRVLAASSAVSIRLEEVDAPVGSKQPTVTEIPMSRFARIRALGEYGMTIPQIARVYGLASARSSGFSKKPDGDSASRPGGAPPRLPYSGGPPAGACPAR